MALLKDILYKVKLTSVSGSTDIEIVSVQFDSRKVEKGCLFVATKGVQVDGHAYITAAIEKGAVAVLCEVLPIELNAAITYIQTNDSNSALGITASNFYGNPSAGLQLVGITGTNGKTTSVTLLHRLFRKLGYNVGLLSTVENKINDRTIPATHTTPDAVAMNKLLKEMLQADCTHCFMEVSSHSIVQQRIAGLKFAGAVFTNITHDHLDYHQTFEAYIKAKKLLFDNLPPDAFALVNADDKRGKVMLQNTKAATNTFALRSVAHFKGKIITNSFQGLELEIDNKDVWFKLTGVFNAYNLLGVYGTAVLLGEDADEVLTALSTVSSAKGRFEQLVTASGINVIVDYAHTPDALENVLNTINEIRNGNEKLLTVVGCGGNRDKEKRPLMAEIASRLSDILVLTSDNPRNEDPEDILRQMQNGVRKTGQKKTFSILDRKEAIKMAVQLAEENDIILIAGKGHETYQEIKGIKYPFDDKKVLAEMLNLLGK